MIQDNDAININSSEDMKERLTSNQDQHMSNLSTEDKILLSESLDFIKPHGSETQLDTRILTKGLNILKRENSSRKSHVLILASYANKLDAETIAKLKEKYVANSIDLYLVLLMTDKESVENLQAMKLSVHESTLTTRDSEIQESQGAFMRILLAEHLDDIPFVFDQLNTRLNLTLSLLPVDQIGNIPRSFWFSIGINSSVSPDVWKLLVSNLRHSISLMTCSDNVGCCVFNDTVKVVKGLNSEAETEPSLKVSRTRFEEAYPLSLKPQMSLQHSQMNTQAANNCCILLGRTVIAALFAGVIIVILKLIGVI